MSVFDISKLGRYGRLQDVCVFLSWGVIGLAGVWNLLLQGLSYGLYVIFIWLSAFFLESGVLNNPDTKQCIDSSRISVRHGVAIIFLPSPTPAFGWHFFGCGYHVASILPGSAHKLAVPSDGVPCSRNAPCCVICTNFLCSTPWSSKDTASLGSRLVILEVCIEALAKHPATAFSLRNPFTGVVPMGRLVSFKSYHGIFCDSIGRHTSCRRLLTKCRSHAAMCAPLLSILHQVLLPPPRLQRADPVERVRPRRHGFHLRRRGRTGSRTSCRGLARTRAADPVRS